MGTERLTIEVDEEVTAAWRAAGIDPVRAAERLVRGGAPQSIARGAEAWAQDNRAALEAYAAQLAQHGTFASRQRRRRTP